jgi:hypothetical protein
MLHQFYLGANLPNNRQYALPKFVTHLKKKAGGCYFTVITDVKEGRRTSGKPFAVLLRNYLLNNCEKLEIF